MAVVITPFGHQNIPINTPFSLNVPISGNPDNVSVRGRLKGFYYNWTGTQVELRGTPEVYIENTEIVITADDESYTSTFSIIPIAPVIGALTRAIINRGIQVVIPIPIVGTVNNLVIEGPWIGLKYRLTDNGAEMYGIVPASSEAEFTIRTFTYSITAYNGIAFDTATLTVEIAVGS